MDNHIIRKAQIKDWPTLINIFDKSLRSSVELSEEDWASLYKSLISFSYPTFDTYIFETDGKEVAYISYWCEKKFIKSLYVLPEYMNKGIGNKLIKYVIDTYREDMTIGVKPENKTALHLYQKHGFEIISKEDYDTSGIYYPHYILKRTASFDKQGNVRI